MSEKNHQHKQRKHKKKIPLFYKVNFSILLIAALLLAYFLIVVAIEPKSIPLVTKKIEEVLQNKLQTDVSLSQSYVSFTRYGTLKVAANNLKILYTLADSSQKQEFVIPQMEAEFSLLKILLLHFEPSKIKVINPTIVIDELKKLLQQPQQTPSQTADMTQLIQFLSRIRNGEFPIENIEIENAVITAKGQEFDTEILLKKSQISTDIKGGSLFISSVNKLSFDDQKNDVDLNMGCLLAKSDGLKCDVALVNFNTDSISDLHENLTSLQNINANFNANASFVIKDGKLGEVLFNAAAKVGDFVVIGFFDNKIDFSDLSLSGKYDNNAGVLNLSQISTNLSGGNKSVATHLDMSLLISAMNLEQSHKLDFDIKLQNASIDEMERLWPSSLHQAGIREWVIKHINGGVIRDAHTNFSLQQKGEEFWLNDILAQIKLEGANLAYDQNFPTITNISATAEFTKNSMKIAVQSGEVLNSKISAGLVEIADFSAPKTLLKISGKSQGHAADSMKHIDHKSAEFNADLEKHLNGDSQNEFDIRLPLHDKMTFQHVYIAVNSNITALKNDYVKGDVVIRAKKDFNSNDFAVNVNLSAAELNVQPFDIKKTAAQPAELNLIVALKNPQVIRLKNIELWKNDASKNLKNAAQNNAKITGEIEFEVAPFLLTGLDLKNNNFGKNNYVFSYHIDKKAASQKISLKGQQFNLAPFIEQKFFAKSTANKSFPNSQMQFAVNNLGLMNGKMLKGFYLALGCRGNFCDNGVAKANYGKGEMIDLHLGKNSSDAAVAIEGRITDIGYVAEALGISGVISGGNSNIKLQTKPSGKSQAIEGNVTIDDEITIYDNETVKRLAKNDLFSQIKDKIFSDSKTTFNSAKIDFAFKDGVLDLRSLIANNYKIGITAKGNIDLNNNSYAIKGMIIPGFIVNNLFGIGKIPLLGNVLGLLTGGEGGGVFGIRYEYTKSKDDAEAKFETSKVSSFVPTTIKNLFDLI